MIRATNLSKHCDTRQFAPAASSSRPGNRSVIKIAEGRSKLRAFGLSSIAPAGYLFCCCIYSRYLLGQQTPIEF
jgi:hypothetical protein